MRWPAAASPATSSRLIACSPRIGADRKSTRLNSSHTVIYTLSLHDALPICLNRSLDDLIARDEVAGGGEPRDILEAYRMFAQDRGRSEEHTSELQSHSDLHSFPTRRSSDLPQSFPRRSDCPR